MLEPQLEQDDVAPDAVEPADPLADADLAEAERAGAARGVAALSGKTPACSVQSPPVRALSITASSSARPTPRPARPLGDVDALLADAAVDGAAGVRDDGHPADDLAVQLGDEAVLGEVTGVPLLPGRDARLERRATGRDPLGEDRCDGRVVVADRAGERARPNSKLPAMSRWATFDCYGTLIDWNAGHRRRARAALRRRAARRRCSRRYHELEPEIQAEGYRTYQEVLALTLERLANEVGLRRSPRAKAARSRTRCRTGRRSREVPKALEELRRRGWSLAILSNIDHALMVESEKRLGVPFDLIVTAEDVRSYKPAHGHWERFFEPTTADKERHVHVGASALPRRRARDARSG